MATTKKSTKEAKLNRFTFQILGNIDCESYQALYSKLIDLINSLPNSQLTTLNLTAWQDENGKVRQFNQDGTEYFPERENEKTVQPLMEESIEDEG